MRKAVVLLSGGLDSATVMAIAVSEGYEIYALTFYYGQRHQAETYSAMKIVDYYHVDEHRIIDINLRNFGGSALTDDIDVPKDRDKSKMSEEIPITYVPARNTIFLAYATAWAEVTKARAIFIGVNSVDYSGYPDCRKKFIDAFQYVIDTGTKAGVEGHSIMIRCPIMRLSKEEIIKWGHDLGVPYHLTHSCYDPSRAGFACGQCDSCILRREGFLKAGVPDPTNYQKEEIK